MPVRRSVSLVAAGCALALSWSAAAGAAEAPKAGALSFGDEAPKATVEMKSVDGKAYSIASVRGEKGTLVVFSCNHCPWVKAWEDRITEIGNLAHKDGFGVIVINPNDPERNAENSYAAMQTRAKERGFEFPYVVDETSEVARAFGATRTPEVFLFDGKGKLVYHGAIDDNAHEPASVKSAYLKDALGALKEGKEVATKSTKALGCTVQLRGA
jgi:peroxiredoxin